MLTGDSDQLSDPTILWDPDTQRFYYNVWDVSQATMQWGFSKDSNPTSIPSSFSLRRCSARFFLSAPASLR